MQSIKVLPLGTSKLLMRLNPRKGLKYRLVDTSRSSQSHPTMDLNGRSLRSRIIRLTKRSRLQEES